MERVKVKKIRVSIRPWCEALGIYRVIFGDCKQARVHLICGEHKFVVYGSDPWEVHSLVDDKIGRGLAAIRGVIRLNGLDKEGVYEL